MNAHIFLYLYTSSVRLKTNTEGWFFPFEKNHSDKVEVGCVVSLGTGQIPLSPLDPLHVEYTNPISSAVAFKNLSLILVDQVYNLAYSKYSKSYFRSQMPKNLSIENRNSNFFYLCLSV